MISRTQSQDSVRIMVTDYFSTTNKDRALMLSRRQARRLGLQVLFCNEFLREDIASVAERIAATLELELNDFSRRLIFKTTEQRNELDEMILINLKDKDLHRVAILDKVLIRIALSELLYFPDIPAEVTINEALEISKEFISNRSSRFINGILDTLFKYLHNNHKINKKFLSRVPAQKNRKTSKGLKQ